MTGIAEVGPCVAIAHLLNVLSKLMVLKDLMNEDSVGIAEYHQGATWHFCQPPHSLPEVHTD